VRNWCNWSELPIAAPTLSCPDRSSSQSITTLQSNSAGVSVNRLGLPIDSGPVPDGNESDCLADALSAPLPVLLRIMQVLCSNQTGFGLGIVMKTARPAPMPSRSRSGLSGLNVSMTTSSSL